MLGHEELLRQAIEKLKSEGFRVIRLDRRVVPDAIAIKDNEVVAVEASTSFPNIYLTKRKFEDGTSQYDAEIIVTRKLSDHYHSIREYNWARLFRDKGMSYTQIQKELEKEFKRHVPRSLICDWVKGKKKPLTP